jgi:hypothetical protein
MRIEKMNTFMNALWNAVGSQVSGSWNQEPFLGTITSTRAKYGTDIQVTVEDGDKVYLIDGTTLYEGGNRSYSNLHVYF